LPVLALGMGRKASFPLRIERRDFQGRVRVYCPQPPPGVTIQGGELAESDDAVSLELEAARDAIPATHHIEVRAEGGGVAGEAALELTVLFLPPDFQPDGDQVVTDASGGRYYQAITCDLPGGGRARFVLIPRQSKEACRQGRPDLVPTFYLMQDKVSLGLFRPFAAAHPELVGSRDWEKGRNERYPVLNVKVEEAHAFASTWLKGRLPSVEQWDKASGTYLAGRGEGPYKGVWNIEEKPWFVAGLFGLTPVPLGPGPVLAASARASWMPPDVACNLQGPRPVGAARDDVSPFGCRDMAGNGQEWTRTLKGVALEVPVKAPQAFHRVWLRGRTYEADHPLRYDELDDPEQPRLVRCPYLQTDRDIGFRVVLEP
jgi:formylglycine-generating enzyme required for sulfatase activity